MRLIIKSGNDVRRFDLTGRSECVLGRSEQADCSVPTEQCLSRRHVMLRPRNNKLDVERLAESANPIVFKGITSDRFRMTAGDYFVVGGTTFHLESDGASTTDDTSEGDTPAYQYTMGMEEVKPRDRSGDRLRLLDLLELPVVLRTKNRSEFLIYACGLLRLTSGAGWVQVLRFENETPLVLAEDAHVDCLRHKPVSLGLLRAAVAEAPKPVMYCWSQTRGRASIEATAHEGIDWAVCCAMPIPGEPPVVIYLAGSNDASGRRGGLDTLAGADMSLRDTARLVGLVADMIHRALAMQKLESWKSRLGQFFSEKVVSEILDSDANQALEPRITEATVMFFDIRGFSLRTEQNLNRIVEFTKERRKVLSAIGQCVTDHDGVIIAYVGDGLLACWNVPTPNAEHVSCGCLAALQIVERMATESGGWQCGIGLGMGEVVAGWLGSDQKEQYDILGPVVNQASRIEGITKVVGVPLLVSESVAKRVPRERIVTRRVGRFLPLGMQEAVDLHTVGLAPQDADARRKMEELHGQHEKGLKAFEAGEWEEAFRLLHSVVEHDAAARYVYKLALQGKPPRDWKGVIELTGK